MMKRMVLIVATLAAWPVAGAAVYYDQEPQIVVETKNCSGATGLATFSPERLHTIQSAPCPNPDATDEPLKQVFLRNESGSGQYEIVWVDEAGAQSILAQLKENRAAALERASGKKTLIVR